MWQPGSVQAPWWWSKTETCRNDIYVYFNVNFNMFFKIKKCICGWVNCTTITWIQIWIFRRSQAISYCCCEEQVPFDCTYSRCTPVSCFKIMQKKTIDCLEILQQCQLFWLFAFQFNINYASSEANMSSGSREPLAASYRTTYSPINLLPRLEEKAQYY